MIFDPLTRALYGDDGEFIKSVMCPLALTPDQLQRLESLGQDRFCSQCDKVIHCIDDWTDEDARSAVEQDRDLCVFATPAVKKVTFLKRIGFIVEREPHVPVVTTLRDLTAMDMAIAMGHELVFVDVPVEVSQGSNHFRVMRHRETRRLGWSCDYRLPTPQWREAEMDEDWELVRDWFLVRDDRPFPLAAYVIPKGLQPGSRVFVEDVIEDIPIEVFTQGDVEPLCSAYAVWDGCALKIELPNDSLYAMVVG